VADLYANENFPEPVVVALRALGHAVLTSREAGNAGRAIPDEDVLAFATNDSRVLVTLNRRDFIRLHGERPDHAGIIVCTVDPDVEGQARRISDAIRDVPSLAGRLIRVNRPGPP
jgi:hypothetical protein